MATSRQSCSFWKPYSWLETSRILGSFRDGRTSTGPRHPRHRLEDDGNPWKIKMVHLQITHEKIGTWSEPNLHEDMFQPLIFRGVWAECRTQTLAVLQPGTLWTALSTSTSFECRMYILTIFMTKKSQLKQPSFINGMNIHSCSDYRWNTTAAFPRLVRGACAASIDHISLWPPNWRIQQFEQNFLSIYRSTQHPGLQSQMKVFFGWDSLLKMEWSWWWLLGWFQPRHSIPGVKFQPKKKGLFLVGFFGAPNFRPDWRIQELVYLWHLFVSNWITLQGTNISHLRKFGKSWPQKCLFVGDIYTLALWVHHLAYHRGEFSVAGFWACHGTPSFNHLQQSLSATQIEPCLLSQRWNNRNNRYLQVQYI